MNFLDMPMYTASMAGRLVGLSPERVRRWLKGYNYSYTIGTRKETRIVHKSPVIHRGNTADLPYASFLDLIDLRFIKEFLDYGISLQKLRKALEEVEKLISGHHFAHRGFFTNGKKIYLQLRDTSDSDALMELLSGGQWVITPIIRQLAHQIDFDISTGYAKKWFPLGPNKQVVLDPKISFGQPTLIQRGITTAVIYDFFKGEGENIASVCSWMDIGNNEVKDAIEFEKKLAIAA